jgi:septal ring factor EnvC (AmiA/AmiB activator)
MTQPPDPSELETAISAVYRGPLEEFVGRRDTLAKELRAAKRREDADRVKALRKPSRMAWTLDNIVHEDPASIDQLAAAISAATTMSGTDVRTAIDTIRAAIRTVAAAGAHVAIRANQPIEVNALVAAVHAVIGDATAFGDLRAGRLVDVPDGGGLDILAAITTIAPAPAAAPRASPPTPATTASASVTATPAEPSDLLTAERAERLATARADLRRAEASLDDVRKQSERAQQTVQSAQQELDTAERALSAAKAETEARRSDLERALRDAEAAAARFDNAQRAVATARSRVAENGDGMDLVR